MTTDTYDAHLPTDERHITDEQVFAAFDLNLPALAPVRLALDRQEFPTAKKELLRYFEIRQAPFYLFDYRTLPLTPIDTDQNPHNFQSSLGLDGSLKDFCLYAGNKLMDHVYVRPGRGRVEINLGADYENLPHFDYRIDLGKKNRAIADIFVRGQIFEYLAVLYHETGDDAVLAKFEEYLGVFFKNYPLVLEDTAPDACRFSLSEDRDVMSTGWLALQYISLFYTRIPYEIAPDTAFEIIKRIWFLGVQFRRFDADTYRKHNHHMWERGLVPFLLAILLPEVSDFAPMKALGAAVIRRHILDDFNEAGGYSEHSIPYWSGAALCEMLYRGIYLAQRNQVPLLDAECQNRLRLSFRALALISPPQRLYSSVGDNGGPMVEPILHIGAQISGDPTCKAVLAMRMKERSAATAEIPLDYCDDHCGFVCCRSSFSADANFMLLSAKVNCGDSGHNHMDMLSIFVTFGGQEFIGEPHARPLYQLARMGSEERGYLYNMGSHNTVLAYGKPILPDAMYANKWGVYRPDSPVTDFVSTESGTYLKAHHDGYTICRHTRSVLFHRSHGMLITDAIDRGNRLPSAHIQRWHLLPDVKYTIVDSRAVLLKKQGVQLLLVWSGAPAIHIWQKTSLYPQIVRDKKDLSTILDVAFGAGEKAAEDIATLSQTLLILNVTNRSPVPDAYTNLAEAAIKIQTQAEIDVPTALAQFSSL